MAYSVNTGTGDFYAPTFSASDFTKERYQLPGGTADSGFEYGDRWAYTGSDPFWQQAFGNINNYMPYFGEDGSLDSLMVKSGDKTGTVFDYTTQNGQYVPTGMGSQEWDTNSSFRNMALGTMALTAIPGITEAMQGANAGSTQFFNGAEGILANGTSVPGANMGLEQILNGLPATGAPSVVDPWATEPGFHAPEGSQYGSTSPGGDPRTWEPAPSGSTTSPTGSPVTPPNTPFPTSAAEIPAWLKSNASWMFPLFGAATGALADRDPQTSTSQTQLPPWLQSLGPDFAKRAGEVANMPYPGQAGFNADQNAAFQQYRDQASSPLLGAASGQLQSTLNGDYLKPESNPYLKGMIDQATQRASGAVNSAFNKGGAWGGSANQELLGRTIGETTNNLNYTNYNAERGRQMTAAGLAPGINSAQQMNTTNLLGAGNQQQQFAQQGLNGPMDWGFKQLQAYGAPFGFNQGNTTTQTQPGPSAFQNIMGGLLTGGAASRWWG
jgi:hypothetical protein